MTYSSYVPTKVRIAISRKAFYTLKCDENCFITDRPVKNKKRISDTFINNIINNIDLTMYPEPQNSYNKSDEAIRFDYKPNKESDKTLSYNKINYRGTYVSMLLEEYAKKAYFEREQIFFKRTIEDIENIILGNNLLILDYRSQTKLILPLDIRTDEWSSYNYLIGLDLTDAKSKTEAKLVNLRISYISYYHQKDIKAVSLKCDLSPNERNEIEERIIARGVQFVHDDPIEVTVKFTDEGKNMYDHMVFMRPQINEIIDEEQLIYKFKCTATQARFYFFKFGADAEIISPKELRDEFLDRYKEACLLYKGNDNA